MTIRMRPTSLHESIDTFTGLQEWIDQRLENIESDLGEGELLQSIGLAGKARLDGLRWQLLDLAFLIAPSVAAEVAEQATVAHEDATEQAYKAAGFTNVEPLMQRLMDGDR